MLQWAGPVLALTTFITIAAGHVLVRRLHRRFSTGPAAPFFILGAAILLFSLFQKDNLLSGVLGILAVTFAWDGIEIYRQEKRTRRRSV